jgi:dolichol-phosphate mannosyltransferase
MLLLAMVCAARLQQLIRYHSMGNSEIRQIPTELTNDTLAQPLELSLVIPTFNEHDNLDPLLRLLEKALAGVRWEVIFVDDDSADGTAEAVRRLARTSPHIRAVQRIGRRGLSTAVIEGALASSGQYIAVMDADMQHDERLLPQMLHALKTEPLDIVVGSRYVNGGGVGTWDAKRHRMSLFATKLSRVIVKDDLSDPMSGFFMITRPAFESAVRHVSGEGYKVLLDLFASAPSRFRFKELPYEFRTRQFGESKIDSAVLVEYLLLIVDKLVGHIVPARFIMFAMVGASGVIVHFFVLMSLLKLQVTGFSRAQLAATFTAMTTNFFINNLTTYRDRRLKQGKLLIGLLSFYAVCGVGVVGNVGIARYLFHNAYSWWAAAGAGILVGTVWNYAASSVFTWRK